MTEAFDATVTNAAELTKPEFWRAFAPRLHVEALQPDRLTAPGQSLERLSQRMRKDGYFEDRDPRLEVAAAAIAPAVRRCVASGLPPVFVWVYDEPWEYFRWLRPVIQHFLGPDYRLLPSFWAWHVDPQRRESGWRPHRDNSRGVAADGTLISLTCWIPISDANPLNSCMYLLPAHMDPQLSPSASPHTAALAARALPAKPGDYLIWNQVVLHWGSQSSEFADSPRMSLALEFQRAGTPPFREPLLDPETPPPFKQRVRLIAMQIQQFTHMYGWSDDIIRLAAALENATRT